MPCQREEIRRVPATTPSVAGTCERAAGLPGEEEERNEPLSSHAELESPSFTGSKSSPAILRSVLRSALDTLNFPIGWIYQVMEEEGVARIVSTSGIPEAWPGDIEEIRTHTPPHDTIFGEGRATFTADYARACPEKFRKPGIVSLASIPLSVGDQMIGALNLASTERHEFTPEERSALITIGKVAGSIIREMAAENISPDLAGRGPDSEPPEHTISVETYGHTPATPIIQSGRGAPGQSDQGETTAPACRTREDAAERALKRREQILEAVNYAAERFLGASAWEDEIPGVLRRLGEATGAGRVYVFKNTVDHATGEILMTQSQEWTGERTSREIENPALQALPYRAAAPRWQEVLSAGGVVAGPVRTFPAIERAYLEPQGILSLVAAPIFVERQWWGFIGMDYCTEENLWSPAELDAIPAVGRLIGAAIQRTRAEEIYRKPVEKSLAGVFVVQDDLLKRVNPRFCEIFGFRGEELIENIRLSSLLSLQGREAWDLLMKDPDASIHAELPGKTHDGCPIIVEVFCSSHLYEGKPAVVGTLIDITARKQAEYTLAKSEEKYREFFKNVTDAIIVTEIPTPEREVRILEANDAAVAMLGYPYDELLRMPLESIVDADIGERVGEITRALLSTNHNRFEGAFRNKDGRAVPVEVNLHLFTQDGQDVVLSIAREITERKRMEEEVRGAYQQIEKNMGQFAVLNDEIRNPLQGIIGFAALEDSPLSPKIIELAREIDRIVSELDRGWVESDKVRDVLKRQYGLFD